MTIDRSAYDHAVEQVQALTPDNGYQGLAGLLALNRLSHSQGLHIYEGTAKATTVARSRAANRAARRARAVHRRN